MLSLTMRGFGEAWSLVPFLTEQALGRGIHKPLTFHTIFLREPHT